MFCSKFDNAKINQLHKRVLRCIHNSPSEDFEQLLDRNFTFDTHTQNLQSLMIFMYKVLKQDCPEIAKDFFIEKKLNYNLRSRILIHLPKCNTINYGTNSIFFKGGVIWSNLPHEIKNETDLKIFESKIKKLKPKCSCKICN